MEFHELMEVAMIIAFGVSWPLNVIKSYRAKTSKGKSLIMEGADLLLYVRNYRIDKQSENRC